MSYWTFTDIFEENGPVPSPFHGGFGLLSFQGLRKPAFYAYQFLNRLADEELANSDTGSWACRGPRGLQILFWNYAPPQTSESNQKLFKRDLPSRSVGSANIIVAGLPRGTYQAKVYHVGHQVNDVYFDFLQLGSPGSLTREQVRALAAKNDGRPESSASIRLKPGETFSRKLPLRENDVYLITLER
jgi:xylan 1,4-beta-xylosidase